MLWEGRVFPCAATGGDAEVPEALPAIEGLLPHLHTDWRDRFPRAVACGELEECEPESDDQLEKRGVQCGKSSRKEPEQTEAWKDKDPTNLECMKKREGVGADARRAQ